MLLLHCRFNLPGEHAFDRACADLFVDPPLAEPAINGRADVFPLHVRVPFIRLSATSISCCGVFWLFFRKPCNNTMHLCSTQKITRAIRPRANRLLTSHNSWPNDRTSGIPIGQENSTSLTSWPMVFRSCRSKALQPFAHRLTSCVRTIETCRQAFETRIHAIQYQFWYRQSIPIALLCSSHRIAGIAGFPFALPARFKT